MSRPSTTLIHLHTQARSFSSHAPLHMRVIMLRQCTHAHPHPYTLIKAHRHIKGRVIGRERGPDLCSISLPSKFPQGGWEPCTYKHTLTISLVHFLSLQYSLWTVACLEGNMNELALNSLNRLLTTSSFWSSIWVSTNSHPTDFSKTTA